MVDSGLLEHLAADGASGSEDQGQADNLVEKSGRTPSAAMGTGSTAAALSSHIDSPEIPSPALTNHPQPVDRGGREWRLARIRRFARVAYLLASQGAAPKPRDQATNYNTNLIYKYIRERKKGGADA